MPNAALIGTLVRELVTRKKVARVPEPSLVMDDEAQVAAYREAGLPDGIMSSSYLFHCEQICSLIRPGDIVVDLGCGPGNQLSLVAKMNPDATFLGVDLSEEMLAQARDLMRREGLSNVSFLAGDITNIDALPNASADVVISTVALHHLPTVAHLDAAFAQAARILKPDGGMYLMDFGRLKSDESMRHFAYQHAARTPDLFTLDYMYSLRAAFEREDLERAAARHLGERAKVFTTFLIPFMVVVKSEPRREVDATLKTRLASVYAQMPEAFRRDLHDLALFFQLGGLASARWSHLPARGEA